MIGSSLRCRHWSVLQVVAIVVCYRGKVECDRAQGCVGSQLSLACPAMKVIQITSVVLGDSSCRGASCCIKDSDCTREANANHRTDVHSRCDNKQSCAIAVLREKISCGYWGARSNNDFERITFNCINDPQRSTTTTSLRPVSTENIVHTEKNTLERETEKETTTKDFNPFSDDTTSPTDEQNTENITDHDGYGVQAVQSDNPRKLPAFIPTVCLLTLIAIIIVVAMIRRKRRPKVRPDSAAEIMDIDDSDRHEVINTDENHTMSLSNGNGFPIYNNDEVIKSENKGIRVYENYQVQNKGTRVYENCQVQNNAVYNSVEGDADSRSAEDPLIYADSSEPVYQVPRPISNFYSVVCGEAECTGSTADASNKGYNIYCNLKTMEPANAANGSCSKQSGSNETCNRKEGEYEAMKADKSILTTQTKKKETENPSHKTASDSNTKVNKPSRNVATSEATDKAASKDKVCTVDGYPNPIYEEMSPLIPESMYANAPVLSPNSSVTSRSISTGRGSEQENPYCEMK